MHPSDLTPNDFIGVQITSLPASGTLKLGNTSVVVNQVISLADIYAENFTYTPTANVNGTNCASFTFKVIDNGGTEYGGVDTDTTARTMTIDVNSVNDAPVGTSKVIEKTGDSPHVFTVADFGFSDPSDSPGDTFVQVKIVSVPTNGILKLNGTAVVANQVIDVSGIEGGLLVFVPSENINNSGSRSFTFRVIDNGGTSDGGVDTDLDERTMTLQMTAGGQVLPTELDVRVSYDNMNYPPTTANNIVDATAVYQSLAVGSSTVSGWYVQIGEFGFLLRYVDDTWKLHIFWIPGGFEAGWSEYSWDVQPEVSSTDYWQWDYELSAEDWFDAGTEGFCIQVIFSISELP